MVSGPFSNPLVTVPKAPITIGIMVYWYMSPSCSIVFFPSLSQVDVLILLFIFFQFYSVVSRDSKVDNFASSLFFVDRRTRHAGHCWRSRDELISDVLLWTPTYGRAKSGRPARTYIQQLCEDTGCSPEDPPEAMNDREKWRERVRDIRATSTT